MDTESDYPEDNVELVGWTPWRVDPKHRRRIYDDCNNLLGIMESQALAEVVVRAANDRDDVAVAK